MSELLLIGMFLCIAMRRVVIGTAWPLWFIHFLLSRITAALNHTARVTPDFFANAVHLLTKHSAGYFLGLEPHIRGEKLGSSAGLSYERLGRC